MSAPITKFTAASECQGMRLSVFRLNPALQNALMEWNSACHAPRPQPISGPHRSHSIRNPAPSKISVTRIMARPTWRMLRTFSRFRDSLSAMRNLYDMRPPPRATASTEKVMMPRPPA